MAQDFAAGFYKTQAWKKCREEYAKQMHYLCEDCLEHGIYRPGEIVHHVRPLTPENIGCPEIALSFDNLRLLCRDCHGAAHRESLKQRRFVIGENGEVIAK